ncbi:MAG: ABC transporter permease [Microthrixaceae bacterium]
MADSLGRIAVVARHDLRVLRRDPVYLVTFTLMPIVYMAFAEGALSTEQVVPGAAVVFSGFMVGNLGFAVFNEHGWHTWDRLRASRLNTAELFVGKAIVPVISLGLQLAVLLGAGALLFDLQVAGPWLGVILVAAAFAVMEVALGFALLALCTSVLQLNALTSVGALLFGGLGGAVAPVDSLPDWAQAIAPFTPAYWAMQGFTDVIIEGEGVSAVVTPVLVLAGFAVGFTVVAVLRLRVDEAKTSWA